MNARRKLPVLLIVLLSLGLLFGGAVHSSMHVDDHGLDDHGGDCHFCHLEVANLQPQDVFLGAALARATAPPSFPESVLLVALPSPAAPRAPPA